MSVLMQKRGHFETILRTQKVGLATFWIWSVGLEVKCPVVFGVEMKFSLA